MFKTARKIALKRGERIFEDDTLVWLAMKFAEEGAMRIPERGSDAAEEFGEWIRLGDAKRQSVIHVGTWLIENEDQLRRPE